MHECVCVCARACASLRWRLRSLFPASRSPLHAQVCAIVEPFVFEYMYNFNYLNINAYAGLDAFIHPSIHTYIHTYLGWAILVPACLDDIV